MDHLYPNTTILFFPQVQYLVDENHAYDSEGFHKFPNRTGWKLGPTGRWECESDKSRNPTSFLQAWLFFGLLTEFLGQDSQFKSEEYRARVTWPRWIITTEKLPIHLGEWRERMLKAKAKDDSTLAPLAIRAGLALDQARSVVSKSCSGIHHDERIDDMVALSLMILGETLSNALSGVLNEVQAHMTGWYLMPAIGWGDSKKLLSKLNPERRWCSRSAHYLRSTLRHSASGILFAIHLSIASDSAVDHGRCSSQRCDPRNDGKQSNCWRSTEPCQCKSIGPDLDTLVNIIEQDKIPLLNYNSHDEKITVTRLETGMGYTIVSHVWSDGLGNDDANELRLCRVKGLVEAVKKLEGSKQEMRSGSGLGPRRLETENPFWIDTLAIPVQPEYKDLRKRAIKNMYRVYQMAESTVVVDKGLMSQPSGSTYSDTAMRISRCLWMTRLWTLQEAYLSKELYFIFQDTLVEMERLEKFEKKTLESPLSSVASVYYQGLLGAERQQYLSNPNTQISPDFIASVWKAVQWRNTAHSRHETLALAMLLRFRLEDFDTRPKASPSSEAELEGLMQNLLREIDSKNAIPSGFIFLPGKKLAAEGFRWAPRSWMTGQELEYPSPLKSPNSSAHLIKTGLQVKYPGFRLHNTARLLSINGLFVPTDKSLNNWLSISRTDDHDFDTRYSTEHLELITMNDKMDLDREIALLVIVQQGRSAQIIQRVWVRIEANPQVIQERKDKFMNAIESSPWAESLPPDTIWEVDGPEHRSKSSIFSDLTSYIKRTSSKALSGGYGFRKRTLIR